MTIYRQTANPNATNSEFDAKRIITHRDRVMNEYRIEVDVFSSVQDFYPGLSDEETCKIADKIVGQWDYSNIYDDIAEQIEYDAKELGINLEGKDGVEEPVDNIYTLNPPNSPLFP